MPLESEPTVPYISTGEVRGLGKGAVWPMLPEPGDRLALWLNERDLVHVELDEDGVGQLIALLTDAKARMSERRTQAHARHS